MIGPLLLPRELAIEALRGLTAVSALGVLRIDESQRETAARRLSEVFDVNPASPVTASLGSSPRDPVSCPCSDFRYTVRRVR